MTNSSDAADAANPVSQDATESFAKNAAKDGEGDSLNDGGNTAPALVGQAPSQSWHVLQSGLTALKQKDYAAAIVSLEACQASPDAATRLKAQMGLIKAYVRTHQILAAQTLCQPLCEHANPQVQAWAKQTLTELAHRPADPVPAQPSDATPLSSDPTGFVPLAPSATGFVPLPASPTNPLPPPSPQPSTKHPPTPPSPLTPPSPPTSFWRNAGRSSKWTSLGAVDASGLWALAVGSLVLLFWILRGLTQGLFSLWNGFSIRVNWLTGLPRLVLPTELTGAIVAVLVLVLLVSPWLLDYLLKYAYGMQPFDLANLEPASPEACRLLKRVAAQRRQPLPMLKYLPDSAPLIFTYGYWPQTARIVVSQGLLDQLQDDEIATLVAAELAHLHYGDGGVLAGMGLIAQLPYRLYWSVARWGDRQSDRVLQTLAVVLSALGYGLFWLLRLPGLWLARVRLYYSDRWATEQTGNPNGLSRALLKLTIGTAQAIQQQQQTSALLESFEILFPIGYRSALTIGSLYRGETALLDWDRRSPYRRWLILNQAHPPLGERLQLLMQYASRWRLEPEIRWQTASRAPLPYRPSRLLWQGAPFWGIPMGLGVGLLLWGVGWVARPLRWFEVAWLAGDNSVLLAGCLLGFSIGMFLRINAFFPDIKPANLRLAPALSSLLSDPTALPLDSQPVRFQGTLIGRRGLLNWLYRDLMLDTPTGLIRLHYTSQWGWLGDLLPTGLRPPTLIDQTVTVTGWFRRGATPWIDVDTLQTQSGKTLRSHHPIWSTILASCAALLAVYIILQGG